MSEKHRKFISTVIYWGLVLLLCWVGIRYVLLWLLPFLLALGVASIMEPTVCFLREKLRLRRGFISAILSFVLLALLFAVLTVLLMNLMQQTVRLFRALPQYLAELPAPTFRPCSGGWSSSVPRARRACKGGCSGP